MFSAPKVRLYVRVRLSDGRSVYVDPAWSTFLAVHSRCPSGNQTPRAQCVSIASGCAMLGRSTFALQRVKEKFYLSPYAAHCRKRSMPR